MCIRPKDSQKHSKWFYMNTNFDHTNSHSQCKNFGNEMMARVEGHNQCQVQ